MKPCCIYKYILIRHENVFLQENTKYLLIAPNPNSVRHVNRTRSEEKIKRAKLINDQCICLIT